MTGPADRLNETETSESNEILKPSPPSPWPYIVGLLVLVIAVLALWQWGEPFVAFFRDRERVRTWLSGFGPLAPLISIGLNAFQVLIAPLPGQVVGLANGYLFGVFWGTVYSVLGVTIGSAIAMTLGRWLGRPVVQQFVDANHLTRWDRLAIRRGPAFFFLVFLLPLVPDDIACFAVGLSPLSIPYILTLAMIGRLPGLVASSWIGAHAGALSPVGLAILGAGTLALAGVLLRYRDQLEAWMVGVAERLSERGSDPD